MLSATKCQIFAEKIKWCGRIIDEEGYQLHPQNYEDIHCMEFPITADELSQFVHCCWWMSACIPAGHRRMEPLKNILEVSYTYKFAEETEEIKPIKSHVVKDLLAHNT